MTTDQTVPDAQNEWGAWTDEQLEDFEQRLYDDEVGVAAQLSDLPRLMGGRLRARAVGRQRISDHRQRRIGAEPLGQS
jgi:hypothetical protein